MNLFLIRTAGNPRPRYEQQLLSQDSKVFCSVYGETKLEAQQHTEALLKVTNRPARETLISDLWDSLAAWSQETFGPDTEDIKDGNVVGGVIRYCHAEQIKRPMEHLKLEAQEVIDAPFDIMEHADCLMLNLDAARRAGFTLDQLLVATMAKLAENKKSEYGPPDPVTGIRHRVKPVKVRIADGEATLPG